MGYLGLTGTTVRLENIPTYLRHRVTNAASKSINSKIQWVKYTARGFRNKRNFQMAIYFHCGGLDMALSCREKAERAKRRKYLGSAHK